MFRAARWAMVFAVLAAAIAVAAPAHACPVCFGASDDPMAHGMNNGIFVLLGVIGAVQLGFVALFVSIRRRTRDYQERKDSFEVLNGGMR
jgi:hypothetical protein